MQLFTQQQWYDFLLFLVHLCLKCVFYVQGRKKIKQLHVGVGSPRFPGVFITEHEPGPRSIISSLRTDAPCPKKNVRERDICGTQLTLAQHRRVALSLIFFEGRGYLYTGYRSSSAPMHGWQFVQLSHEPNARHAKAPFTLTRSGNGEERRGECNKLNANRIKWLQIKSNGDADGDGNEKVKKAIGLD